jgi:hypothetical protein
MQCQPSLDIVRWRIITDSAWYWMSGRGPRDYQIIYSSVEFIFKGQLYKLLRLLEIRREGGNIKSGVKCGAKAPIFQASGSSLAFVSPVCRSHNEVVQSLFLRNGQDSRRRGYLSPIESARTPE